MKNYKITKENEGQRLDRFLNKLLPNASTSLIQKSIRKKNIKLNDKKAKANTFLKEGDEVTVYFSDETIEKFSNSDIKEINISNKLKKLIEEPAFEDDNFLVINKPTGLLTQPDISKTESISDAVTLLLGKSGTFSPAPLNRLDRNTSGIVIVPKNYSTQKIASEAIRNKNAKKVYRALVLGNVKEPGSLTDKFSKDAESNKVDLNKGDIEVSLDYRPVESNDDFSLLEIDLHSGKSHQIRAQLAKAGFPILGDFKYGNKEINDKLKKRFNLDHQLLHAFNYKLYNNEQEILDVEVKEPKEFQKIKLELLGE